MNEQRKTETHVGRKDRKGRTNTQVSKKYTPAQTERHDNRHKGKQRHA